MSRYMSLILLCALTCNLAWNAFAEEAPPADFTRFEFEGQSEVSAAVNDYLWRHFKNRPGNGTTLFNKEYLLLSDMWLNATEPHRKKPIQEVHREDLLAMQIDEEGYVNTHQHFSHSHDWGWPFPVWPQAGMSPGDFQGVTAGWLFQELGDLRGWAADFLRQAPELSRYYGGEAAQQWHVAGAASEGIVDKAWQISPGGAEAVRLSSPQGVSVDAFNSPFLQIRWKSETPLSPRDTAFVTWTREGQESEAEARMELRLDQTPEASGYIHSILPLHQHPLWQGSITEIAFHFPAAGGKYRVDSIFTVYDTRHTINNPIFILASAEYFKWTGDLDFLRRQINRLRVALLYMKNTMRGDERNYIRVEWPNHDGLPGFRVKEDGAKEVLPGHGIGSNYWDLMPFGWDDFYATYQYYAATVAMAKLEAEIAANPAWNVPRGALALEAADLAAHAEAVKAKANELFWNESTGRYYASIDKNGVAYDFGYTFLNLEAIWYGIVPEDRARSIMDWISGKRIVEGDTSTGADIYHWRFAPRATTLRNVTWYGQGWYNPEHIPWGGQVQDGGAVLGFTYYDLMARLKVYGPDDAWQRLAEIMAWDQEVQAAGGYRAFYEGGKHGTTLQGCGTPGGLGVDCEFYESSLLPAFLIHGIAGLAPYAKELKLSPQLPQAVSAMRIHNLKWRGQVLLLE